MHHENRHSNGLSWPYRLFAGLLFGIAAVLFVAIMKPGEAFGLDGYPTRSVLMWKNVVSSGPVFLGVIVGCALGGRFKIKAQALLTQVEAEPSLYRDRRLSQRLRTTTYMDSIREGFAAGMSASAVTLVLFLAGWIVVAGFEDEISIVYFVALPVMLLGLLVLSITWFLAMTAMLAALFGVAGSVFYATVRWIAIRNLKGVAIGEDALR